MCELADISMEGRCIKVADIKKAYIENIMKCAPLCDAIDKVVLFGSDLEGRCTGSSDVDIAVFGKYPKCKMYRLKSYNDFVEAVVSYGRLQDYDLLYYGIEETDGSAILQDIQNGAVLYDRRVLKRIEYVHKIF